jgi:hypothetical protein
MLVFAPKTVILVSTTTCDPFWLACTESTDQVSALGGVTNSNSWFFPRVAQRDALPCELALDLPLISCHLSVLEPRPRSYKQTDKNDEQGVTALRISRIRNATVRRRLR